MLILGVNSHQQKYISDAIIKFHYKSAISSGEAQGIKVQLADSNTLLQQPAERSVGTFLFSSLIFAD
jgi:hypothetical protein